MNVLSHEQFEKAKTFVYEKGRPLDRAWLAYHFENGSKENVLRELEKYQNQDGGFGNKLEPDFFLVESSPMATSVAFQYLTAMMIPSHHPIVQKGMAYLIDSYDDKRGRWTSIPQAVNNVPHAPWWHFDEVEGRVPVEKYWGNPVAELTGYLRYYADLVPQQLVQQLTERCLQHFSDMTVFEMHEVLCYVSLANHVDTDDRHMIIGKIHDHLFELVEADSDKWDGYGMPPQTLVHSPQSPFFEPLAESIDQNLDYVIAQQTEQGSWEPTWAWGQYEQDWLQAKEWWKSRITVDTLIQLHRFGRLHV